jgi:hypothetical protein
MGDHNPQRKARSPRCPKVAAGAVWEQVQSRFRLPDTFSARLALVRRPADQSDLSVPVTIGPTAKTNPHNPGPNPTRESNLWWRRHYLGPFYAAKISNRKGDTK